jgi:16S rRNA (guanine1207-N2)-methyltransferase
LAAATVLVGIYATHRTDPTSVSLVDVDPVAVEIAKRNLRLNCVDGATALVSDAFSDLSETGFTKILCNPPYHVNFSVPKRLIEKGFDRLVIGGSMIPVCKREGWYRNKLQAIFGNVQASRDNEYIVFQATKTSTQYARMKR